VLDESRFVLADDPSAGLSTWAVIGFALVGGAILNLMPCVLPVIGLKILAFVEQSHQDRRQIFLLNLWYTLGLMSVFMVLATLAVTLNLGWGQQFSSTGFNIVMAGIVFVMALSFLGVWEIPIPGFVGAGKATELAAREGFSGAFSKGILTTVLATPCSGPFLGPVFGFTLKQPPYLIYAIFACIGLGMASPYLLIGLFPRLIRLLPKPGAWMDTFKQIMGFVLLGTVVYLFTFLDRDYLVPTLALLFGLWAACWWIGRTPLYADLSKRLLAWGQGAAVAALIGWFAFTTLVPHPALLPWEPYSRPELARLASENRTVLVDFTAGWCPACIYNLKWVINTEEIKKVVEMNGVVPLVADKTAPSPEIDEMLHALKSNSIPVLAIFPASRPNEPIILRDLVSQRQVLKAIREAGPSADASPPMSTVSMGGP
jgi:thiol:disulfide interchange protein